VTYGTTSNYLYYELRFICEETRIWSKIKEYFFNVAVVLTLRESRRLRRESRPRRKVDREHHGGTHLFFSVRTPNESNQPH
jgi:hypothetical protein